MTITGPKDFIRHTVPRALSTEPALDGASSETAKVPISADEAGGWDSNVRLELASWDARNPVVGLLIDFSWWKPIKWILALIAAVIVAAFSDELKGFILRVFAAIGRLLRLGSKSADVNTPGRPPGEAASTVSPDTRSTDSATETPPAGVAPPTVEPSQVVGSPSPPPVEK